MVEGDGVTESLREWQHEDPKKLKRPETLHVPFHSIVAFAGICMVFV